MYFALTKCFLRNPLNIVPHLFLSSFFTKNIANVVDLTYTFIMQNMFPYLFASIWEHVDVHVP